jgi:predicted MFS family arabinose efflux permease
MQILIADKLGRIRFMQLACIIVTIGCAIQTASVNLGMFLAGRVISGVAVGSVTKPTNLRGCVSRTNNIHPEL